MINTNSAYTVERICALTLGILFLILGIAGFIPAFVSIPGTDVSYIPADVSPNAYAAGFGYLFGLFPTNFLHNLVHCAVGFLGIGCSLTHDGARQFNRIFCIAYTAIALMGLFPVTKTFFNLMPLFGNNVILNALSAIAAAYYGFIIPPKVAGTNVSHNV